MTYKLTPWVGIFKSVFRWHRAFKQADTEYIHAATNESYLKCK